MRILRKAADMVRDKDAEKRERTRWFIAKNDFKTNAFELSCGPSRRDYFEFCLLRIGAAR
jgi:hypothetical protein